MAMVPQILSRVLKHQLRGPLVMSYRCIRNRSAQGTLQTNIPPIKCDDPKAVFDPTFREPIKLKRELGPREEKLAKMLDKRHFNSQQIERILDHFRLETRSDEIDLKIIRDAADFWLSEMKPPIDSLMPQRSGKKAIRDWKNVDTRDVLSFTEPDLLIIDPDAMSWRFKKMQELGFMSGKNDLYRGFVFAPRAFYLQDWVEFIRKFRYMHHRILNWLVAGKDDDWPVPHPCVVNATAFELSYEQIKSRFEFVVRSGAKSPGGSGKSLMKGSKGLTFETILISEVPDFLDKVAPGVTEEEFYVFEKYISEEPDDEDETIREIALLESQGMTQEEINKKVHRTSKLQNSYYTRDEERAEEDYMTKFSKLSD